MNWNAFLLCFGASLLRSLWSLFQSCWLDYGRNKCLLDALRNCSICGCDILLNLFKEKILLSSHIGAFSDFGWDLLCLMGWHQSIWKEERGRRARGSNISSWNYFASNWSIDSWIDSHNRRNALLKIQKSFLVNDWTWGSVWTYVSLHSFDCSCYYSMWW